MSGTLASAIKDTRLSVFEELIAKEFDDIDLTGIMTYLVDCVDSSALPWLASQFDIEGFKGYDQCTTEYQRRELIKSAIELHRHIGTTYAVRKACSIIGMTPKAIEENVPVTPGGDPVWCAFRVQLNPGDLSNFDANTLANLRSYINYYKRAVCILTEIYIGLDITGEDKIFATLEDNRDVLMLTASIDTTGDFNDDFNHDFNI